VRSALTAITAAVLLSGCLPSDPAAPMAVRSGNGGVEVLYTGCSPAQVTAVAVFELADQKTHIESDQDKLVWQATFPSPAPAAAFQIGVTPSGATESKQLSGNLSSDTYYATHLTLSDGRVLKAGFTPKQLDEHVIFEGRAMTPQEFQRAGACPRE
jgi:hypothetical protein